MNRRDVLVEVALSALAIAAGPLRSQPEGEVSQPADEKRPQLVVQLGHRGTITSVALSPDGRFVLTGSTDQTARLWDAATGREVRTLKGHEKEVESVAFSPDGRFVFTSSADRTARMWERSTGKQVRIFRARENNVSSVAVSRDGRFVLTGTPDGTARLWEAATGKELRAFRGPEGTVTSVAFSPDGRFVLTGAGDSTARLWEAATGKELRAFRGQESGIDAVALSPDGRLVLTKSQGIARLWETANGKELHTFGEQETASLFQWPDGGVHSVAFSPDSRFVLTGLKDGTVRLWEVAAGKEVHTFRGHAGDIWSVGFSPDGRFVLSGSGDATARLWLAEPGNEVRVFRGKGDFFSVTFTADGRIVPKSSKDKAGAPSARTVPKSLQVKAGRPFEGPVEDWGAVVALSPDGRLALKGTLNGTARLFDAATGKEIRAFQTHQFAISSVTFSPDGRFVLTGSADGELRLWETATGKWVCDYRGHAGRISSVGFSLDGRLVLTGGWDGTARLWEAETGKEVRALRGHEEPVLSALFSPDGRSVLTGSMDKTMRMWEAATGKEIRVFRGHDGMVTSVTFSPDGRRVLSDSGDGTARLWEAGTGAELCALVGVRGGTLVVTADNYYMGPKGALQAVAWRVGDRALPFEQFDLKFNRPDLVLGRLDMEPKEVLDTYHQAYRKRLQKMNFTEEMLTTDFHLPEATLLSKLPLTTRERTVKLKVQASDTKYRLDRLNVSVNGVPIFGIAGVDLRGQKTQECEREIEVELSAGRNSLRVSVLNEKGAESLLTAVEVVYDAPAVKPNLYVVAVGVSAYQNKDMRLHYAAKDAGDVCDFFRTKKDRFEAVYVKPFLDGDATRDVILRETKEFLKGAKVDDQVIVFFAGHGLLDPKTHDYYFATVDMDFAAPSKRGLPYDAIEGLLDGTRARRKLLLVDTCHSGEVDKEERIGDDSYSVTDGVVRARGFRTSKLVGAPLSSRQSRPLYEDLFADLRRGTGAVVLAAAGGREYSLESEQWKNGAFTYCLLRGLRSGEADRNKDGRIQVSELRDYVFDEVQRLTRRQQVPTVRRENLEYDFPLF